MVAVYFRVFYMRIKDAARLYRGLRTTAIPPEPDPTPWKIHCPGLSHVMPSFSAILSAVLPPRGEAGLDALRRVLN